MSNGRIILKPARAVTIGDVFSTDGATVTASFTEADGRQTIEALCHGFFKRETVEADAQMPIWTNGEETDNV